MKTREEIVRECAQVAAACWNHYADKSLNWVHQDRLVWIIDETMPQSVSTEDWQAYADEQDRRMEAACGGTPRR